MNPFSILVKIFDFFSVYADPFEKRADRFLKKLGSRSHQDLQILIEEDLVKFTIFLEYKFKGYKKLRKRHRRKLYEYAKLITEDFAHFFEKNRGTILVKQKKMDEYGHLKDDDRFTYILAISDYLKIGERLIYQNAATFEKLLRDPKHEKLVGDCNQITTLYIYLYSRKYPVSDLNVKILPEHICLHYRGVDIETTNASLTHYEDYIYLSPVEEIVAANVLDISDPSEKQFSISPANMLKAAELAFHFSSHRETVEKNLFIAYHNMAIYYAKKKDFKKAGLYANKSGHTKLQKDIIRMEGAYHLKAKRYSDAVEKFRKIGDKEAEKICYQNELADLFDSTKSFKVLSDYRNHKGKLRRMKELAIKVNNQQVVNFVNDILAKLSK